MPRFQLLYPHILFPYYLETHFLTIFQSFLTRANARNLNCHPTRLRLKTYHTNPYWSNQTFLDCQISRTVEVAYLGQSFLGLRLDISWNFKHCNVDKTLYNKFRLENVFPDLGNMSEKSWNISRLSNHRCCRTNKERTTFSELEKCVRWNFRHF